MKGVPYNERVTVNPLSVSPVTQIKGSPSPFHSTVEQTIRPRFPA